MCTSAVPVASYADVFVDRAISSCSCPPPLAACARCAYQRDDGHQVRRRRVARHGDDAALVAHPRSHDRAVSGGDQALDVIAVEEGEVVEDAAVEHTIGVALAGDGSGRG